jgi:prepilin-type N-terminal cleavage/methylation domain-containing protein
MINRNIRTNGFTLIETLVAILILTIAIAGPLTIASRSLNSALIAKDQMTAQYLAQDAIEYIRYARDTNSLSGGDWFTGGGAHGGIDLTQCLSTTGNLSGCQFDTYNDPFLFGTPRAPTACTLAGGCSVNIYRYALGLGAVTDAGQFYRTVIITTPIGTNADDARIEVDIKWTSVGKHKQQIQIVEDVLNWEKP